MRTMLTFALVMFALVASDGAATVTHENDDPVIILPPNDPRPELPACVQACVDEFRSCRRACRHYPGCDAACGRELRACVEECGVVWIPSPAAADASDSTPATACGATRL